MKRYGKTVFILCVFSAIGMALFFTPADEQLSFSPVMTLRQFALYNDIKPGRLKAELGLPHARGRATLHELGMDEQKAIAVASHIKGEFFAKKMAAMLGLFAAAVCLAIILLCRNIMTSPVKYGLLAAAVAGFGFALGKTYNPMVAMVKSFKGMAGLEANPAAWLLVLALFCLLAIIGTKAVCGWACPYGALQELLFKLPLLSAWKKKHKLPFWPVNGIRIGLFGLFIAGLVWNMFGLKQQGRTIYHAVNPFNLFEFDLAALPVALYIAATLVLSLFVYRPHCYAVCPFGLLSWVLERISAFKIRINRQKCTACGACIRACPGQA
ncbi:MAG: 4Fe-4S binding protein, partial [Deltaproteobacteria bacterium]|nr:4Fe-4S binding protein [Deltaproteobacteria bacterium]